MIYFDKELWFDDTKLWNPKELFRNITLFEDNPSVLAYFLMLFLYPLICILGIVVLPFIALSCIKIGKRRQNE